MMLLKKDIRCKDCVLCNEASPVFRSLSHYEQEILNENRYSVSYRAGETILKQGIADPHIISLAEGMAIILLENQPNKRLIVNIVNAWQLLGTPACIEYSRNPYTVIALVDSLVCFIDSVCHVQG